MTRIALLSTSDTDLLSARACGADYLWANPSKPGHTDLASVLEACDLVVVRLLGSPRDLCSGFERFRAAGKPMVVVGGEQTPDAALMEMSTVPIGVAADAHVYLAQGGPENLAQLHAFLSDTVLLTGVGFEPPVEQPSWGVLPRPDPTDATGTAPEGRHPVLPGPADRREHRVRGGAGRRRRRCRWGRSADLRRLAARRPGRPARAPRHPRRPGHHRARRRRHQAGHRERRR